MEGKIGLTVRLRRIVRYGLERAGFAAALLSLRHLLIVGARRGRLNGVPIFGGGLGDLTPRTRLILDSDGFGAVALASESVAAGFVHVVFEAVLGRAPDQPALEAFSSALAHGRLSYNRFLEEVLTSEEAQLHGRFGPPVYDTTLALVAAINRFALERALSHAEVASAAAGLDAGSYNLRSLLKTWVTPQRPEPPNSDFPKLIQTAYSALLKRAPAAEELANWCTRLEARELSPADLVVAILESEEASAVKRRAEDFSPGQSDAEFARGFYEIAFGDAIPSGQLLEFCASLETGAATRAEVASRIYELARLRSAAASPEPGAPLPEATLDVAHVIGGDVPVRISDWKRALTVALAAPRTAGKKPSESERHSRFEFQSDAADVKVTAITSLYRGREFLEAFFANMVEQTIFAKHVELVVVDANSDQGEQEIVLKWAENRPNIKYIRCNEKVSVYEAWNLALSKSSGEYVTNANVDDVRRPDSFERQVAALQNLPFADVIYQDFFYSFERNIPFELIERLGARSQTPLVTPYSMLVTNPPHHAPMWRRSLHAELGAFDPEYQSAGDYEFWMRCVEAGKVFYKLNDPTAAYFYNPQGLSTRAGSVGAKEAAQIRLKYASRLVPAAFATALPAQALPPLGERIYRAGADNLGENYNILLGQMTRLAAQRAPSRWIEE